MGIGTYDYGKGARKLLESYPPDLCREIVTGFFEEIRAKSQFRARNNDGSHKGRANRLIEAAKDGKVLETINLCHLDFGLNSREPGSFRALRPMKKNRQGDEAKLCGDLLCLEAGGYWGDAKGGWLDPKFVEEGRKE